jgi:predicted Zn-dependent peptidase
MKSFLIAILVFLFAQTQPLIAGVLNVKEFKHNGFHVLLAEDHSLPNIVIGLNFQTGSFFDPPGKEGCSRLMLEMILRGTKNRTREQISEEVDFLGANLSTDQGYLSMDIRGESLTRYLHGPYL